MPEWLQIIVGVASICSLGLGIFLAIQARRDVNKGKHDEMQKQISENTAMIAQMKKITDLIEESMEDLLLDVLKNKKRNP